MNKPQIRWLATGNKNLDWSLYPTAPIHAGGEVGITARSEIGYALESEKNVILRVKPLSPSRYDDWGDYDRIIEGFDVEGHFVPLAEWASLGLAFLGFLSFWESEKRARMNVLLYAAPSVTQEQRNKLQSIGLNVAAELAALHVAYEKYYVSGNERWCGSDCDDDGAEDSSGNSLYLQVVVPSHTEPSEKMKAFLKKHQSG